MLAALQTHQLEQTLRGTAGLLAALFPLLQRTHGHAGGMREFTSATRAKTKD